jgi:hypothetical protein
MEGGSAPPEEAAPSVNKFEEYRFFTESTAKLSDRRQLTTQVWVTLHTLLFAALGFLMKQADANVQSGMESGAAAASGGQWVVVLSSFGPLLLLGLFSCVIWRKMLLSYRALIGWRYDQLMEMERSPQLEGLHKFFSREWEEFFGPDAKRPRIGFTRLEALLPTVLIFVYLAFGVVAILMGLGKIPS